DMNQFRKDVAERLKHVASWNPGTTGGDSNTAPKPGGSTVSKPQAFKDVVETDAVGSPRNAVSHETNPNWTVATYLRDIAEYERRNYDLLQDVVARLKRLEGN